MASSVIISTGAAVAPGDVVFSADYRTGTRRGTTDAQTTTDDDVCASEGCYVRVVAASQESSGGALQRQIVSSRLGTVQWEGSTVRVFSRAQLARTLQATPLVALASAPAQPVREAAATSGSSSLGPRPGDTVHVRVARVARLFVVGEIIAIGGVWSSTAGSTGLNTASSGSMSSTAFRGVIRLEDLRPFRPTKDQLQPPPPSASCQPGDVLIAEVISQSDARQYQLSTCAPHCGVVESYLSSADNNDGGQIKLQVVPGRREVMVNPVDGAVVPRWCPLVELSPSEGPAKQRRV